MMKNIIFLYLFFPFFIFSQEVEWQDKFVITGETKTFAMEADIKGNVLVIGSLELVHGYFMRKYDSKGQILWEDTVNGSLTLRGFTTDKYDNFYITGFGGGRIRFGHNVINSTEQIYIMAKFNSSGENLWVKYNNECNIYSLTFKLDTIYGVGGMCNGTIAMGLAAYDLNGNFLWQKQLPKNTNGRWLVHDSEGFYVSASTGIHRINASGDSLWHKGAPGYLKGMKTDKTGNCYGIYELIGPADFDGNVVYPSQDWGGYSLAKLDKNGNYTWAVGPEDINTQTYFNLQVLDSFILVTGMRGNSGSSFRNMFYSEFSQEGVQQSTYSFKMHEENNWGTQIDFFPPKNIYVSGNFRNGDGMGVFVTKIKDDSIGIIRKEREPAVE
jgi:hypothetical protein